MSQPGWHWQTLEKRTDRCVEGVEGSVFAKVLGVVGNGLREASEFGLEPSFHRTDWLLRWGLSIAYNFMTPKSLSDMLSFWVLK